MARPSAFRRLFRRGTAPLALASLAAALLLGVAGAELPVETITVLSDGASKAEVSFASASSHTLEVTVPADWSVQSASITLTGKARAVTSPDQRNEAAQYEGTWSVRAQQFQPSESTLAFIEIFLARTSYKGRDLTVEIRTDDGEGYPSGTVLASVAKSVAPGGYRWEPFHFPETLLRPGERYWILAYVANSSNPGLLAGNSLSDYGYFLGMSLNDDYKQGDSGDLVISPSGPRWEKYSSRRNWDLLFRTNAVSRDYPTDVGLAVGDENASVWRHSGELRDDSFLTIDFSRQLETYLSARRSQGNSTEITIPLLFESHTPGILEVSDIKIVRKSDSAPAQPSPTPPIVAETPDLSEPNSPVPDVTQNEDKPPSSATPTPTRQDSEPGATATATASPTPPIAPQPSPAATATAAGPQGTTSGPAAEALPLSPQRPRFLPPSDISLKSLGYRDITVQGVAVSTDLYFPGAGGYPLAEGNYIKLYFGHSEALLPDRSTMSVRLNDVPIADVRLTTENAGRTELRINLPAGRLLDTANRFKLQFYMRIMEGICTDELNNPALNSTVYAETLIHYEYASLIRKRDLSEPNLSLYPLPFVRPSYPWPDEVFFVVPENPSSSELTAASSIAAKLGQLGRSKPVTTTLILAGQLDDDIRASRSLIFVGKADSLRLPIELKNAALLQIEEAAGAAPRITRGDQAIAEDHGLVEELLSPWNSRETILLVTGATDRAVSRAGAILTGNTYLKSLNGSWAVITEDPRPPDAAPEPGPDSSREATLAQMGVGDMSVNGLGDLPSAGISFSSPPPNPKEPAYADVVFSHSPLVGTEGSSLRIEVNGIAVASVPLDHGNAEPTKIRVNLPAVVLKPGRNSLVFRFTIRTLGTQECGPVDTSRAWAVIHATTLIHLPPAGPKPPLDLSTFTYPLLRSGPLLENAYLDSNLLVLPGNQTSWRDVLQTALELGRLTTTDIVTLPAALDTNLDERLKANSNLVIFGAWGSNRIADEAMSLLPLQFVEETGKTISKEREKLVGVKEDPAIGVVQQVQSPWNADLTMLLLSGTSPETLAWSISALAEGGLKGNLATTAGRGRVSSFEIMLDETYVANRAVRVTIPLAGTASVGLLVLASLALVLLEPWIKERKSKSTKGRDSRDV